MKKIVLIVLVGIISCLNIYASNNFNDIDKEMIFKAMQDEINRSMKSLKLENLAAPYYIAYKLEIKDIYQIKSVLGGITESGYNRIAQLDVELRVGDYKFDNTNFFDVGLSFFGSGDDEERFSNRNVPIELDYNNFRRELWLATDAVYKRSSEIYSKKEAILKNLLRKDTTDDFLYVEPKISSEIEEYKQIDLPKYESMLKKISSIFLEYPYVYTSSVGMEYLPELTLYLNSEGMKYERTDYFTGLEVVGYSKGEDGMPIIDHYTAYGKYPNDLPTADSIYSATQKLANNIKNQLNANYLEDTYVGPVIFSNQAAGELFAQLFAPNLVTQRKSLSEGGFSANDRFSAFQRKIGGRVLPEFLSLKAIPNTSELEGTTLCGHYNLDEQGIKPQDLSIVEQGYLKNLLSDRTPTKRVKEPNGHHRGGASMYSNLILISENDKIMSDEDMKAKMLELLKARELPYGIIIDKILNQNILFTTLFSLTRGDFRPPQGEGKFLAISLKKIYQDGSEEIIRGGVGAGFSVQSFRDIIFVSNDNYVHNILAPSVTMSFMTGGDSYIGASLIIPDLLFEDAEIRMYEQDFKKPIIINSPLESKN